MASPVINAEPRMRGIAPPVTELNRALKNAADDAFLPPDLARKKFAFRGKAR